VLLPVSAASAGAALSQAEARMSGMEVNEGAVSLDAVSDHARSDDAVSHAPIAASRSAARPVAPVDAMPPARLEGGETILVVDDDPGVLRVTAASLRRFGYVVIEASSGDLALAASRGASGVIHLLVTDVVMPGMSGPALADALRRERPDTPVLFVSGYPDGTLAHHGVAQEGVALLPKPFERAELARRVRALIDATVPTS
jgi:CheY-like chemotaxis protein